jgi:hypothetical protein
VPHNVGVEAQARAVKCRDRRNDAGGSEQSRLVGSQRGFDRLAKLGEFDRNDRSINANRRRIAVSTRAMDLSAVFIVPMTKSFSGSVNSSLGEHCSEIASSRYSSRK